MADPHDVSPPPPPPPPPPVEATVTTPHVVDRKHQETTRRDSRLGDMFHVSPQIKIARKSLRRGDN